LVLEPEGTFVIEGPALNDAVLTWMGAETNPYPRGTSFNCGGGAVEAVDFNFLTFTPPDAAPPETTISDGPQEGDFSRENELLIAFAGSDDLSYASKLTFSCSLDGSAAAPCTSPYMQTALSDGEHTFAVRARDEAGKVDETPAAVSWTVDATPPSKPTVHGPRKTRSAHPRYEFQAHDGIDRPTDLLFRCSLDSRRLHPCGGSLRPTLRPGVHVLRAAAVDRAGNKSATATLRILRIGRKS
jgi:large repetitive protein